MFNVKHTIRDSSTVRKAHFDKLVTHNAKCLDFLLFSGRKVRSNHMCNILKLERTKGPDGLYTKWMTNELVKQNDHVVVYLSELSSITLLSMFTVNEPFR